MIEMGKQYRTRDGREVRILCTDRQSPYPVVAIVCNEVIVYSSEGKFNGYGTESCSDLIEVNPRIVREAWVNVNKLGLSIYLTRALADNWRTNDRLACVKLLIDCEEGEGL